MRHFLILTSLFIFNITQLQAATFTWNGDGDGMSWQDPDNWDLDAVPTIDDDVRIENMADQVTLDGGSYGAKSIYLAGTCILNSGDALTVNKSISAGIEMVGFAKLIVNGELLIIDSMGEGVLADDDSSITVSDTGELFITGGGDDGIKNGILVNNNIVTLEGENISLSSGLSCTTINDGTINIKEFGAGMAQFLGDNLINNFVVNIEDCTAGIIGNFTNHGNINIKNILGADGVRMNSAVHIVKNFGNINFEDVNYLITGYAGASFTNETGGTITSTNPTSVLTISAINFAGEFDFTNSGNINLSGNIGRVVEMAFDPIFSDCDCEFINNGSITVIDASTGWNFNNNASFINNVGAILTMDIEDTFVFHMEGSQLLNSGTIVTNISSNSSIHLELSANSTLTNEIGGIMELEGGVEGINNTTNSNSLTNAGKMTISNVSRGISSSTNNSFYNSPTGELNINNALLTSIKGASNNEGVVLISGSAFSDGIDGHLTNTGNIEISDSISRGIVSANLINNGIITINDSQTQAITCHGTSVNSGTININECMSTQIHLSQDYTFINSGNINITGGTALRGIVALHDSNFTNESTGNIYLDGSSVDAIATIGNSTFINRGIIDIENCVFSGIFTSLQSTFTNEPNAQISISTSSTGIKTIFDSVFNNDGIISINAINQNVGWKLQDIASVNNNILGVVNILNADMQGIHLIESTKLNNFGALNLEGNQTAITNSSIINNDGILKIMDHALIGIDNSNSSSIFNNNGSIEFMKSGNATDIRNVSGAVLKNDGTILSK